MARLLMTLILSILFCLPVQADIIEKVTVTKYCWTGSKTTSNKWPYHGCIALSRDIIRRHKLKFGDKVIIPSVGTFVYDDKMPPQWKNRCDVFTHDNRKKALKFGKLKNHKIIIRRIYVNR